MKVPVFYWVTSQKSFLEKGPKKVSRQNLNSLLLPLLLPAAAAAAPYAGTAAFLLPKGRQLRCFFLFSSYLLLPYWWCYCHNFSCLEAKGPFP
jgi:hypothetical protein